MNKRCNPIAELKTTGEVKVGLVTGLSEPVEVYLGHPPDQGYIETRNEKRTMQPDSWHANNWGRQGKLGNWSFRTS